MGNDESVKQAEFANFDARHWEEGKGKNGFTLVGDIEYDLTGVPIILELELDCPFAGYRIIMKDKGGVQIVGLAVKRAEIVGVRYPNQRRSSSSLVPRITSSALELAAIRGYNTTHPNGPSWTQRDESKQQVYRMVAAGAINSVFDKMIVLDITLAKRWSRVMKALVAWRRTGSSKQRFDEVVAEFDKLGRVDFALVDVVMDLKEKP